VFHLCLDFEMLVVVAYWGGGSYGVYEQSRSRMEAFVSRVDRRTPIVSLARPVALLGICNHASPPAKYREKNRLKA